MFLVLRWWSLHTKKITAWHSLLEVILGYVCYLCTFQCFLRTFQYFLMKFYVDVLGILWRSLHYFFFHIVSLWGSFWCMFLYFLRKVRYFLIKFCIDICSTTRMVITLKNFIHIIYFSTGGHSGGIFGPTVLVYVPLFLENPSYFLIEFCIDVFSITLIVTALKKVFHTISLSLLGAILEYFGAHFESFLMKFSMDVLGSFYFKWCKIFEASTWPISEFDKKLPSCYNI